jgi:hypothetical protein
VSETLIAERWLMSVLSNDATLTGLIAGRVYGYVAPDVAGLPFVVFKYLDGADEIGIGATRLHSTLLYTVEAVIEGESFVALETIVNRIDVLLHGNHDVAVTGGSLVECLRQRPVATAEVIEGGVQYRHLGGIYQLRVR